MNLAMDLNLIVLKNLYAICKLDKDSSIPDWVNKSDFYSLTSTMDELSIVCNQAGIKPDANFLVDKDWRCLKIDSVLDLSLIGIIADISNIFKDNKIPIFTVSTYNTDYILVREQNLNTAIECLRVKGYKIIFER
jgi:uncharacterized protein